MIDRRQILGCLEMDDELLVEESACEMIYLRDKLVAVIRFEEGIPPDEILDFKPEFMIARIKGLSCWIPVCEREGD